MHIGWEGLSDTFLWEGLSDTFLKMDTQRTFPARFVLISNSVCRVGD